MEVTDMILDTDKLVIDSKLPVVTLLLISPETRESILSFVKKEHASFLQYYETPKVGTYVYTILHEGQMVGSVLIEKQPDSADTSTDGAIACLIIAQHLRGQKIGSAAIAACCLKLKELGFRRVIAEWVASIELYKRFGFQFWKTREISLNFA